MLTKLIRRIYTVTPTNNRKPVEQKDAVIAATGIPMAAITPNPIRFLSYSFVGSARMCFWHELQIKTTDEKDLETFLLNRKTSQGNLFLHEGQ